MGQGTRVFLSVTGIVLFFGVILLLVWLWYARQLEQLNRLHKPAAVSTDMAAVSAASIPSIIFKTF